MWFPHSKFPYRKENSFSREKCRKPHNYKENRSAVRLGGFLVLAAGEGFEHSSQVQQPHG
jgi:hypothetical protein